MYQPEKIGDAENNRHNAKRCGDDQDNFTGDRLAFSSAQQTMNKGILTDALVHSGLKVTPPPPQTAAGIP